MSMMYCSICHILVDTDDEPESLYVKDTDEKDLECACFLCRQGLENELKKAS